MKYKIEDVSVDKIHQHPQNARRGNVRKIQESIEAHGFFGCLIVQQSTGYILAGNHRYKAAVGLGYKTLPVHYLDVDDQQAKKILLADNYASDLAIWDDDLLRSLLDELDDLDGTLFEEIPETEELRGNILKNQVTPMLTIMLPIEDAGLLEDAITATGLEHNRPAAFKEILSSYVKSRNAGQSKTNGQSKASQTS